MRTQADVILTEVIAMIRNNNFKGRLYKDISRDVTRRQIPKYEVEADFQFGFPIVSLKETNFWNIATELSWFLRGETDVSFLKQRGVNIWDKDGYNQYVKDTEGLGREPISIQDWKKLVKQGDLAGDVGKNYSHQWRNFGRGSDQIVNLVLGMQENIMNTRLIVTAWNPDELNETALPPCHYGFQVIGQPLDLEQRLEILHKKVGVHPSSILNGDVEAVLLQYGIPEYGFYLDWNQRSTDVFLGLPYNIASYALLAKLLEKLTGYTALGINGSLKCVHLYENQFDGAEELIDRGKEVGSKMMPTDVVINIPTEFSPKGDKYPERELIHLFNNVSPQWFTLIGYTPQEPINVDMLAPKKI